MDVRIYRAKTMQQAIRLIRQELGPDASVLHTREVNSSWTSWLTGATELEVTASNEVPVPSRFAEARRDSAPTPRFTIVPRGDEDDAPPEAPAPKPRRPRKARPRPAEGADQLCEADPLGETLAQGPGAVVGAGLAPLLTSLAAGGIDEAVARKFVQLLPDDVLQRRPVDVARLRQDLVQAIAAKIPVAGPIVPQAGRCRVVALVGPTGVGKTTTIAKLAANFRLKDGLRVGLITVDTFRIAAVEQLKTYAEIVRLPMEVVSTPREMRAAVQRLRGLDLVLIDTAGRSPKDEAPLHEMRALLSEASVDETHLVLSAAAGGKWLGKIARRFEALKPTSLILSKLDESESAAELWPLFEESRLGLSYVADGQNVPSDIRAADAMEIATSMTAPTTI